ncbi:hypothetical protein GGF50DRAFT_55427 [Schizophyllum commune]
MTLPWRGAYVVLSLDPASSLRDIDDPIVREGLQKMKCGRYVATATEARITLNGLSSHDHHPLSALMPQRTFTWDFVVKGLPSNVPEVFFQSYMTVPILPNTAHPESRRPAEPCPPLPWDDCYHARLYRTIAICERLDTEENPQSCLSPEEAAVLDQYISTDNNYSVLCERAKEDGVESSPPHDVPAQVLMAIRLANQRRRVDGKPWWAIVRERAQERARKRQEEEAARAAASHASDSSAAAPLLNGRASSPSAKKNPSHDQPSSTPAAAESSAVTSPPAAQATQERDGSIYNGGSSTSSSTSGPEAMLAALLGLNELEEQLPWIKIESYDIRQFDVPPHPSGFFEELKELKRIRTDYVERQRKRLERVQRQDDDYMASIEARRRSAAGPAKPTLLARFSTSTSTYTTSNGLSAYANQAIERVKLLMSRRSRAKGPGPLSVEPNQATADASSPPILKKPRAVSRLRHLIFSRIPVRSA